MIFDFHTHIFPDKIVSRAVSVLKQNIIDVRGIEPRMYGEPTLSGIKASMEKNNVDFSLVLPIATNVKQSESINSFAAIVNKDEKLYSFGSVHPYQDNAEEELEKIKGMGFKGIKLHPQYQDVYITDTKCRTVLKKCEELGLIVTVHAGIDIGMLPPVKCTPQMIYDVMQSTPDLKLVAAHMGGWSMWDDVKKYLIGTNIYFDTSFSYEFMADGMFSEFLSTHENILFGTDFPWGNAADEIKYISSLVTDGGRLSDIMHGNAERLLGIRA